MEKVGNGKFIGIHTYANKFVETIVSTFIEKLYVQLKKLTIKWCRTFITKKYRYLKHTTPQQKENLTKRLTFLNRSVKPGIHKITTRLHTTKLLRKRLIV